MTKQLAISLCIATGDGSTFLLRIYNTIRRNVTVCNAVLQHVPDHKRLDWPWTTERSTSIPKNSSELHKFVVRGRVKRKCLLESVWACLTHSSINRWSLATRRLDNNANTVWSGRWIPLLSVLNTVSMYKIIYSTNRTVFTKLFRSICTLWLTPSSLGGGPIIVSIILM